MGRCDAVYIFENIKAGRVKVGMTRNDVRLRLKDVARLWSGRKPTCQVCGCRRLAVESGLFPKHQVNGRFCEGGYQLPLEKDVSIAESHLANLLQILPELSGSEKGSVARETKSLERRIEQFRDYLNPVGIWRFGAVYYTDAAGHIESLSHEILSEHLDSQAPLGEVFCCSLSEAAKAVESALSQLDLLDEVRKEERDDTTSAENGECIICGGNLTKMSYCPECAQRFREI